MKDLILVSYSHAETEADTKWFNEMAKTGEAPDLYEWGAKHRIEIIRKFPSSIFDRIESRDELFKFLKSTYKVSKVFEILEVPENLEFLNLDQTFAYAYEDRVDEEYRLQDCYFKNHECTQEELDELLKEKDPDLYNFFQRTTPEPEFDFSNIILGDD